MANSLLDDLLKYCREDNRVCPCPIKWNELYHLLPAYDGRQWRFLPFIWRPENWKVGERPGLPLILSAWWWTSDSAKQLRFMQHIYFAGDMDVLEEFDRNIRNLSKDEWLYTGEIVVDDPSLRWNFEPKSIPPDKKIKEALSILIENWERLAGPEIYKATQPLRFTGKKYRRLLVLADSRVKPP